MTQEQKHTIDRLESIEFHDAPVKGFYIQTDEENILKVDYFIYVEDKKDYDEYSIIFSQIGIAEIEQLTISKETDMEISSFDYVLKNDSFDCSLFLLLGFGQPSLEIKVKCGKISIIKDVHNIG